MIEVTRSIQLDERELEERFVLAQGPGGQNVNKVSSAVELRWDARNSPALTDEVRARLERLAGRRMTKEGVLVLISQRFRDQPRNRADALDKLLALIRQAAEPPPPPRKRTRPTFASKQRRLEGKSRRSGIKAGRGRPSRDD